MFLLVQYARVLHGGGKAADDLDVVAQPSSLSSDGLFTDDSSVSITAVSSVKTDKTDKTAIR